MHRKLLLLTLIFIATIALSQQPTTARESKFVNVFGARMHYVEAGSGPVLVLVHGLADDTTVWEQNIDPLAQHYRVVVVDQIGFGKSDKPPLNYRVATFSDFLAEFLAQLKIENATLVGNSLGGWVSAHTAIAYPQRVSGVVLVNSAGYSDIEQNTNMRFEWLELSSLDMIRKALPYLFHDKKLYQGQAGDQAARALLAQRIANQDGYTISRFLDSMKRDEDVLDGRLSNLRKPTLVLWGENDTMVPLKLAERLQKEIPGSRLVRIPECGHMPQLECPAAFNAALLKHLRPPG